MSIKLIFLTLFFLDRFKLVILISFDFLSQFIYLLFVIIIFHIFHLIHLNQYWINQINHINRYIN